jgi:antitoxin component YwqK of YwqJK toxin-antitoxin module
MPAADERPASPAAEPELAAPASADPDVAAARRAFEETRKSETIACPSPAVLRGEAPPAGAYAWCELSDGRRHGPWMVWPGRGAQRKIATYVEGKLEGSWLQWDSEHDMLSRLDDFSADVHHGRSLRWHTNGRLAALGTFERGAPRGRFRAWSLTGALLFDEVLGPDGGTIMTWDETMRVEETWRGAALEGPRRVWYDNGQLESETQFEQGLPHGPFASWYRDGRKRREGVAARGVAASSTEWDERGEIIEPMCAHGPCDMPPER